MGEPIPRTETPPAADSVATDDAGLHAHYHPGPIALAVLAVTVIARVVSGFRAGVPLGVFAVVQSAVLVAVAWVIARLALNVSGGSRRAASAAFCVALIAGAVTGQWAQYVITQAEPTANQPASAATLGQR